MSLDARNLSCFKRHGINTNKKRTPQWDFEKLYTQRQRVQGTLEEKLFAIECGSANVEVHRKNIKEFVLDTISDLVGKVEKRAREPWTTREMMGEIDEIRKWKNDNSEEGKKNYRRLRNELKRATECQEGIS
jgi:hypothetical protein